MLVLSRKAGERIHIGDDITVEVRRLSGNRVALAVEAPRNQRILRGELKESAEAFEEQPQAVDSQPLSIVIDAAQLNAAVAAAPA